jgi:hypothetical protein
MFKSQVTDKNLKIRVDGNKKEKIETMDRMEELQRRKDREGGEHLEMMIKQTERGNKKPKIQIEKVFIEDTVNMVESRRKESRQETEGVEVFKRVKEITPGLKIKTVEKVSLIDIKIDKNIDDQQQADPNKANDGALGKRDHTSFKKDNYANMFDSDIEEQESRNSDQNNKGFLEEQNEKKEKERLLKEQQAHQKMEQKVEGYLRRDKKLQEPEEDIDEKEEEPLNSQDDISGNDLIVR